MDEWRRPSDLRVSGGNGNWPMGPVGVVMIGDRVASVLRFGRESSGWSGRDFKTEEVDKEEECQKGRAPRRHPEDVSKRGELVGGNFDVYEEGELFE